MSGYESKDLWELFLHLNPDNGNEIDPFISSRLKDINDIFNNYYLFTRVPGLVAVLPKTTEQINRILNNLIDNPIEGVEWWKVSIFAQYKWINGKLKDKLLRKWLNDEELRFSAEWVYQDVDNDSDLYIPVLEKLIQCYRFKKSQELISHINNIFINAKKEQVEDACKVLEAATPAITVCLLNRDDIPDESIVKGLRALSKLSKQRNINVKIDFKKLEHLGPKMRLDAMKQLMGIMDKWSKSKQTELPFKSVPTEDEIRKFLFPCSFKYNDQVASLMERYNEITNPKPNDPNKNVGIFLYLRR